MSEDVRRVFNPRAEFTAEDGDLGMAGAWCPQKDPEKFYAIMPWENYESLRAVVAGVHEAIGESDASDDESLPEVVGEIFTSLRAEISEKDRRIEKLENPLPTHDRIATFPEVTADRDRLRAKVERLKASNDFLRHCTQGFVFISEHGEMETWVCAECRGKNWRDDYGVWITDEQIDAAVEYANECRERGWENAWSTLNECGIVECPECGGSMHIHKCDWSGSYSVYCPRCHGHGWIREERGDE